MTISTGYGQQPDVRFRIPITLKDSSGSVTTKTGYFGVHPSATYCADPILTGFTDHWFEKEPTPVFVGHDSVRELTSWPPCSFAQEVRIGNTRASTCSDMGPTGIGNRDANIHVFNDTLQIDTFLVRFCVDLSVLPAPQIFSWPSATALQKYCDSMFFGYKVSDGGVVTKKRVNMFTQSRFVYDPATDPDGAFTKDTIYMYHPKKPPLPPDTVHGIKPLNSDTSYSITDSLKWQAAAGAFGYKVQLSTDRNFQNILFTDSTANTFELLSGRVIQYTRYYWRVIAFSPFGVSYYRFPADSFRTVLLTPSAPSLIFPAKGQTNIANPPRFRWFRVPFAPGTASYQVRVSSSSSFPLPLLADTTLTDTSVIFPFSFFDCDTVYWKVRATNPSGTGPDSISFFRVNYGIPGTVSLVLPADNATNLSAASLFLTWTGHDTCTDGYRVQVTKDTLSATFVSNSQTVTPSFTQTGLSALTTYFWHVRAENPIKQSVYSPWRSFTTGLVPPGVPTRVAPPNASTIGGTATTLVWNKPSNFPSSYKVEWDTSSSFNSSKREVDSSLTDTTKNIAGLLGCTTYYWHVLAKNDSGSSAYSTVGNFRVPTTKPDAPKLESPADNAQKQPQSVTLTWSPAGTCPTTKFFVTVTDTLGAIQLQDSLAGTSIVVAVPKIDTKYLWSVYASNAGGVSSTSTRSFRTAAILPPPQAQLISPPNGSGGIFLTPTLVWDSTDRAKTWKLEVAYDSNFIQLVVKDSSLTKRSRQIGPLLNTTAYFWRVTARNDSGYGPKSDVWKFFTLGPPIAPTQFRPSFGEDGVAPLASFVWSMPDGATSFHLQISRDSAFTNTVYNDSTLTLTTWTISQVLEGYKLYYWRVRAKNSAGFGLFSPRWSFRTNWVGPADWTLPLAFAETGPARDTIYFGIHPSATYRIDPSLGEFELPQSTPGFFDVRFLDSPLRPGLLGEGVRVNFHPFKDYHQIDTFRVNFQPGVGTYPMKVSWIKHLILGVCDSMVIVDEFNGIAVPRKRMDLNTEVTVASSAVSTLLIFEYGAHPLGVRDPKKPTQIPRGFVLEQNYPNPFNPSTSIQFSTETRAEIHVAIYDVLGNEIARLADGVYSPGVISVVWDGRNDRGYQMPSGVYYVRMIAASQSPEDNGSTSFSTVRKMLMLK